MSALRRISDTVQQSNLLKHVLFWLAIFLYAISKNLIDQEGNLVLTFSKSVCIIIPQILASYYISYVIIDKLLAKKKYVKSVIYLVISSYLFIALGRILIVKIAEPLFRKPPFEQETIVQIFLEIKYLFLFYLPSIFYTVFIFLFVKYFLNYKAVKEQELKHRTEKVTAELKTLKAQLNPHFLFNTLNNIYVLSLDNSPQTPRSIEKLSKILDHVLYRCNTKYVSLSSEIALIENYIELEKLRYDDRLEVRFKNHIEQDGEIAPLILLSLVENAFKHGAGEDSGSPKIDIDLYNTSTVFKFVISNTVATESDRLERTPIGLKNIKKQLDLIYPGHFELHIDNCPKEFTVTVTIKHQ